MRELRVWRSGHYENLYSNFIYMNMFSKLLNPKNIPDLVAYYGFQYPNETDELYDESFRSGLIARTDNFSRI